MNKLQELEATTGMTSIKPEKHHYRSEIHNTPFWIIGNTDDGYHITMGKYRITKEPIAEGVGDYEALQYKAETWLETNQWNVILSIALIAISERHSIVSSDTIKPSL